MALISAHLLLDSLLSTLRSTLIIVPSSRAPTGSMKFSLGPEIFGFILAAAAALAADGSFNLLCYTTNGSFGASELYYKDGLFFSI